MNVVETEENTLGITKFHIIQLHAGPVSELLSFMIVTFNVLKCCRLGIPHATNSCMKTQPVSKAEAKCIFRSSGPYQTVHPAVPL